MADQIARAPLVEVEQRIASLTALKAELQRMVTSCSHGRVDQCRVIEALKGISICEPGGAGDYHHDDGDRQSYGAHDHATPRLSAITLSLVLPVTKSAHAHINGLRLSSMVVRL